MLILYKSCLKQTNYFTFKDAFSKEYEELSIS